MDRTTHTSDVDIMMIGHFARDRVVVDGHGQTLPGGAVYYGGVALRRLGLRVAIVTRVHPAHMSLLDDLRAEGVRLFVKSAPETSGIENIYDSQDMERRTCRPLGFAGPFRTAEIPDLSARLYVAASIMAGEIDLSLLEVLAQRGPVALDMQGFVRVRENGKLVFRPWRDMEQGLALVSYLKVDRAEAELLTGETDLHAAGSRLSEYGPREIVITESAGVTVLAEGKVHRAPFTPRSLDGRTGRGDTCFSAYLGLRLTHPPAVASRVAAVITTHKQETPGPWKGSRADLEPFLQSPG
jgi:sugar/nucleoside kinase (ribokinase family)